MKFQNGRHIVFLESSSEAFISNVTSLLNSFLSKECQIILITTNKDKAYDGNNISNNFLTNLSFIYPSINKPFNFQEKSKFIKKYNSVIKNNIGLRLQSRLTKDQAKLVAKCNSVHRDISLNF